MLISSTTTNFSLKWIKKEIKRVVNFHKQKLKNTLSKRGELRHLHLGCFLILLFVKFTD